MHAREKQCVAVRVAVCCSARKGGREEDRVRGPEGEGGGERDEGRKDGTERGRQEREREREKEGGRQREREKKRKREREREIEKKEGREQGRGRQREREEIYKLF